MLATLSTLAHRRRCSRQRRARRAAALTSGYHLAFWIAAGLVLVAIAVAVVVVEPAAKAAKRAERRQRGAQVALPDAA